MILVRKHDKLAWNPSGLKNIEHGQAFRDGKTVIQFVMDNLYHSVRQPWYQGLKPSSKLTSCGVAHSPVWSEGSHFSYPDRFSHSVPPKSCSGKKSSSVAHWFWVEKTPSWHTSALNLRPRSCPWIQSMTLSVPIRHMLFDARRLTNHVTTI